MSTKSSEISQEAAAVEYGLSARTLRRYGLTPRRSGRRVFYLRTDLETEIARRTAVDRNGDQHRNVTGADCPAGNLMRETAFMAVDRCLVTIETLIGRDFTGSGGASPHDRSEVGLTRKQAAVVVARSVLLARAAAEHYLRSQFDQDFATECGQGVDAAMSAMTGLKIESTPPPAGVFTVSREFAPEFRPVAALCVASRDAKASKSRARR